MRVSQTKGGFVARLENDTVWEWQTDNNSGAASNGPISSKDKEVVQHWQVFSARPEDWSQSQCVVFRATALEIGEEVKDFYACKWQFVRADE